MFFPKSRKAGSPVDIASASPGPGRTILPHAGPASGVCKREAAISASSAAVTGLLVRYIVSPGELHRVHRVVDELSRRFPVILHVGRFVQRTKDAVANAAHQRSRLCGLFLVVLTPPPARVQLRRLPRLRHESGCGDVLPAAHHGRAGTPSADRHVEFHVLRPPAAVTTARTGAVPGASPLWTVPLSERPDVAAESTGGAEFARRECAPAPDSSDAELPGLRHDWPNSAARDEAPRHSHTVGRRGFSLLSG